MDMVDLRVTMVVAVVCVRGLDAGLLLQRESVRDSMFDTFSDTSADILPEINYRKNFVDGVLDVAIPALVIGGVAAVAGGYLDRRDEPNAGPSEGGERHQGDLNYDYSLTNANSNYLMQPARTQGYATPGPSAATTQYVPDTRDTRETRTLGSSTYYHVPQTTGIDRYWRRIGNNTQDVEGFWTKEADSYGQKAKWWDAAHAAWREL